jgi:hypothetical protein
MPYQEKSAELLLLIVLIGATTQSNSIEELPLLQHLLQHSNSNDPVTLKSPFFQGILPIPLGAVCFPDGVTGIVVHWDFSVLEKEFEQLDYVMNELEHYGRIDTKSVNESHQHTLHNIEESKAAYQELIDTMQRETQSERSRRSPEWDSIGHLFGIATTGDIQKLHNTIQDNLLNTTSVLLREANHLTATEDITHDLAQNHKHLQNLINAVQSIRRSVIALSKANKFGTPVQLLAYQHINHIATSIHKHIEDANEAMTVLGQGRLPITVLSVSKLARSITAMTANKTSEEFFPYYQGVQTTKYYEMPIAQASIMNKSLLIHVSIPVGKINDRYQVYQLEPIPYRQNNVTRTWRGPTKIVAVNREATRWIELSNMFNIHADCWGRTPPLCHGRFPELAMNEEPCLKSLFHANATPPAECTPPYRGNGIKVHLRHWYSTYWAATLFHQENINFRCYHTGAQLTSAFDTAPMEGSLVIHIPDTCSTKIGSQRIKAYQHFTGTYTQTHIGLPDSREDISIITALLNQTINPNWTAIDNLNMDASELLSQETSVRHMKNILQQYVNETRQLASHTHPYGHPVNHVVMTGWTLLILVGVGFGLWRCRRLYNKLREQNTRERWGLRRIIQRPAPRIPRLRQGSSEAADEVEMRAFQQPTAPTDTAGDTLPAQLTLNPPNLAQRPH